MNQVRFFRARALFAGAGVRRARRRAAARYSVTTTSPFISGCGPQV
jgi:hypothetical protein